MANLLETGRPYLHMSAGTFVNNVAGEYKTTSKQTRLPLDTTLLESLALDAKKIEQNFYEDFEVADAVEWADKYLARDNNNLYQIASSVWNSHRFKNKLYGELSTEQVLQKVESKLGTKVKQQLEKEISQSASLENAVTAVITNILMSLIDNPQAQKDFRKSIVGETGKQMRRIISGSTVIPQLTKSILFEESTNLIQKAENCYQFFKEEVIKKLREKRLFYDTDDLDTELKPYKELLKSDTLLKNQKNNIIGEVEEKGDAVTLALRFKQEKKDFKVNSIPNKKVKRIGVDQKVKTKIDMTIQGKSRTYRFQQKNTDKDIFREFENIGNQALQNHSLFFTAHSTINFDTFRKQVEKVFGKNIVVAGISQNSEKSYLDLLEYLIVNINVLNQTYNQDKGGKLYKKEPPINAEGTYPRLAMKLLSDIVTKYCLLFFSDIEKEMEDLTKTNRYDFIIFNSRFLIPMSVIYDGFIQNLKQTSNQINKEATYLDAGTAFKKNQLFSQSDYNEMVSEKESAVADEGGFLPSKQYSNTNLVQIGKNYGQEVLKKLQLGSFVPNVNLASLIPEIPYF